MLAADHTLQLTAVLVHMCCLSPIQTNLSHGTASMLLEQSICALAGRGFFSTSKFCGPPGFRRSTFSEGIALRWQQSHGSEPLCAKALEHALMQGWAAHGAFVY